MSDNLNPALKTPVKTQGYIIFSVAGQLFGIPIEAAREVLGPTNINFIPMAPKEVAGSLNLRGYIVTAININKRIGLDSYKGVEELMAIVVEHNKELYALLVEQVNEVMDLKLSDLRPTPIADSQKAAYFSKGVYRLEKRLLIELDLDKLLDFSAE